MKSRGLAPCRADLAGGTLDIWPIGLMHPGAVTVNVAVPVFVDLEISRTHGRAWVVHDDERGNRRILSAEDRITDLTAAIVAEFMPSGSLRVEVSRQAPMGSGLGGSSAYGCALASAILDFQERRLGDEHLVAVVRDLEARLMGTPTGCQDHWAAVRGGILAVHPAPGGDRVEPLEVEPDWVSDRLTVFFTGWSHHSGMVNWQAVRRRLDGDADTAGRFQELAEAAAACREGLLAHDTGAVGAAVDRDWTARRRLAPEICPAEIEKLECAVRAAGAIGFKACGAGGGGSVAVWHPPGHGAAIRDALVGAAPDGVLFPPGVATAGCRMRNATDSESLW